MRNKASLPRLIRTPEAYPFNHEPEVERPLTGWRFAGAVALGVCCGAAMVATGLALVGVL